MLSGDGGTEAGKLVGLLDLPRAASMDRSIYPLIEDDLALAIIDLTNVLLQKNLDKEIELWSKGNTTFDRTKWDDARQNAKPLAFDDMPTLTASYDMGWQKRSIGRRYDSHSGHAALVGKLTRKPIAVSLLSKFCRTCAASSEAEEHDCVANFDKNNSSGSMEPSALVGLAHQLLDENYALLQTIIADDDSSVRAQMKWSNADWMIDNKTNQPPKIYNEATKTRVKCPDYGKL